MKKICMFYKRCGFQHNDTHLNDIQHKNNQLDALKCNTE